MGSSTSDIASILEDKGIIKNALIYRFYIKFKNESDFQAGEYTFTKSMTVNEITESLKKGRIIKKPVYTVTIPEGKNIQEIADIYANHLPIKEEELLDKVNNPDYIKTLMEKYPNILTEDILNEDIRTPLEGYLFAATYNFYYEEVEAEEIKEKMHQKTKKDLINYLKENKKSKKSINKVVKITS